MVIAKIHQNGSARATLKYVLSKAGACVVGGHAADWVECDALTKAQLASHIDTATGQLQQAIALKSLAQPLYHISLSLPPTEALDDEQLCAFAEQYLAGLILSAEQPQLLKDLSEPEFQAALERFRDEELYKYCYTLVRHTDQPHPHVHLVIAKTNLETEKAIPTSHDRYRSQRVLRYLERQHGLAVQPHSWEVGRKAESTQQVQTEIKTSQPSVHKQLQTLLDQAATKSQTVPAFIEQVQAAGVEVRVQFTRTGKSKGISYSLHGVALAGNALGNRYSFKQGEPGLVKNLGLSYEPERDRPLIQALCKRPPATLKTAPQEAALAPALSLAVAQQQHQAWVSPVAAAATAERAQLAAEAEAERRLVVARQRLAAEAERQRLAAEAAAEKARLVAEAERVRLAAAAEAERQRLAAEAAAIAEKTRLAAERQQQTAQREAWGWAMTKVAAAVLRVVQQVVYEGKHYRFRFDGKTLTIEAQDGRGVLVSRQGDQLLFVSDQITEADQDYFQAQGQALQQRLPMLDVSPPPTDPKTTWER